MLRTRLVIGGATASVLVASGLVAPLGSLGNASTTGPDPCLLPVSSTNVLNTASSAALSNGVARLVTLPSSLPSGVTSVTLQVRATGTKAGDLAIAPASSPTLRLNAVHVLANKWQSS